MNLHREEAGTLEDRIVLYDFGTPMDSKLEEKNR
jgi:hypothetical protein